jgi:HSP20 family protein
MATLGRWRGNEIDPYRRSMTRLLEDFFGEAGGLGAAEAFRPGIELCESEDAYEVVCELPGINPDDVEINVHQNVLTIRGERRETIGEPIATTAAARGGEKGAKTQGEVVSRRQNRLYSETFYGSFIRSLNLPGEINRDQVKASYKDGLLKITLPKAEAAKPRAIQIERKD